MVSPIQRAFTGGEISPTISSRADLPLYQKSLRTMRNVIALRQGGAMGRPGTMYVGTTLNGGNAVRLIPFIFNETGLGQSYVLEFGNQYIAFYQNGGNVVLPTVGILGATQANPCVVTSAGLHGYSNGDIILITGVLGMSAINSYFIVKNVTPTTYSLADLLGVDINSTGYDAFITCPGGSSKIYKIASPYTQSDLSTINFYQSNDIMTITHQNYPPNELKRFAATSWILSAVTFDGTGVEVFPPTIVGGTVSANNVYYQVTAVMSNGDEGVPTHFPGGNLVPSAGAPITISWAPIVGAVSYRIYKYDVGPATAFGVTGYIGTTTEVSFTDNGITANYSNNPPVSGSLKALVAGGDYPAISGYSQQRRCFANTPTSPVSVWESAPGSPTNFTVHNTTLDDDAIEFSIAGEEVNAVRAVLELKFMLLLTAGAELFVQGNGTGVVTPSSINASVQSQYGCSGIRPLRVGDVLLFNQALGSFIRDLQFDFYINGYKGNDITIFASHLFEGFQIVDWAYQKTPDSTVWVVRSDGVLLSCTYVKEQEILAWAHHDFTNGFVENICSIPENGNYAVYVTIRRVINGNTFRYLERVSSRIWTDPLDATSLDCFAKYDGRNTGATTMLLYPDANVRFIELGVNDGITMREPLLANVTLLAIIPPGAYTPTSLATAVGVAMSAVGQQTYVGTLNIGRVEITCDGGLGTFFMDFGTNDPYASRSAGAYLGFDPATYSVGGSVIAPTQGLNGFASGPNAYKQSLTLQASSAFFNNNGLDAQVGDQIFIQDALFVSSQGQRGNQVRLTIQSITSVLLATVTPNRVVPDDLKQATTNWSRAVKTISGLFYLEGQEVSVWADRFVVGSPNNSDISTIYTVANGIITLDKPYSVVYVGLPMTSDIETLDMDTATGDSVLDTNKNITRVAAYVVNTRGLFAGQRNPDSNPLNTTDDPLYGLFEKKPDAIPNYDSPPPLETQLIYINIDANWNSNGRVFIRQVDPVPTQIISIVPEGLAAANNKELKI